MLAIKNIDDWVQVIIVLVIFAGSALSGIVKAIIAKVNRSKEEANAERDLQQRPLPPRAMDRYPPPVVSPPPVARPMPPRYRLPTATQRPAARPFTPQRPQAEIPRTLPPVVQTILDVVLDAAVDLESAFPKPRPPQPAAEPPVSGTARTYRAQPPPAPSRSAKATGPKRPIRRRSIEDREEQKANLVEKRIGHVEPHVASATPTSSTVADSELFELPTRTDLRRAIILNEILSPPLALRGQP